MKEPLIKSLILFASMFFVAHGITQFFMVDYMDYLEKQRNQISLMSVVTRHHGDELEKKMPELVERMTVFTIILHIIVLCKDFFFSLFS